jgi:hypothetical protein
MEFNEVECPSCKGIGVIHSLRIVCSRCHGTGCLDWVKNIKLQKDDHFKNHVFFYKHCYRIKIDLDKILCSPHNYQQIVAFQTFINNINDIRVVYYIDKVKEQIVIYLSEYGTDQTVFLIYNTPRNILNLLTRDPNIDKDEQNNDE